MPPTIKDERLAAHWRRLGLAPGAPECAIKAAHRYHIEVHHPDRGGSLEAAQQINVAYDELKGRGSKPNEHVAHFFDGAPWHVLGLASNADPKLADRVARQLCGELSTFPRLLARVEWALGNFGKTPARIVPPPPPPRPRAARFTKRPEAPPKPAIPPRPEGLPESAIDLGDVAWRSDVTRDVRLTWKRLAPYVINVDAAAPLVVKVTSSKTIEGRFVLTIGIDWDAPAFSHEPSIRGHALDATITVRWPGDEAKFRVRGTLLYPPVVSVSPLSLDLGTVDMKQKVRATMLLISTAATTVDIDTSVWLARCDAGGKAIQAPLKLPTNTPVRVVFDVRWDAIIERIGDAKSGKPVRPTGKITVRWDGRKLEVPAQMVARRR
ncbi:MAG: J domain-containing protein [Dehalococcoidia bacterium]